MCRWPSAPCSYPPTEFSHPPAQCRCPPTECRRSPALCSRAAKRLSRGGAGVWGEKSIARGAVWVYKAGLLAMRPWWHSLMRRRFGTPTLPHEVRRFVSGQKATPILGKASPLFVCRKGACLTIAGVELKMKGNLLLYKFTRQRRPGAGRSVRVESAGPSFF